MAATSKYKRTPPNLHYDTVDNKHNVGKPPVPLTKRTRDQPQQRCQAPVADLRAGPSGNDHARDRPQRGTSTNVQLPRTTLSGSKSNENIMKNNTNRDDINKNDEATGKQHEYKTKYMTAITETDLGR